MMVALIERKSSRNARSGQGAEPRYVAIKQSIIERIEIGALKPGDRIPSEAELVEQFGVSRMTANRALRELQNAGIITRLAGVGSFIAEPKPIGQVIEIRNIAEEIRERGHEYHAVIVKNAAEKADETTSHLLGVTRGTPLFHSIIVHHEADQPLQHEDRYVLAEIAPEYGEVDFTQRTPNEYLTAIAPIERFEHRVRAMVPDAPIRKLLGMRANEPALVMTRRTWSRGRVASFVTLTHPGHRFELSASL